MDGGDAGVGGGGGGGLFCSRDTQWKGGVEGCC